MKAKSLEARLLGEWLTAVRKSGSTLIAPVQEDGISRFREVEDPRQIWLGEGNTIRSPKEVLYPRSEPLLRYRLEGDRVALEDPEVLDREVVLFGVRPCDASGLEVLGAFFSLGHENPYFHRRREHTTVVGLSCLEPGPACFCTAVGLSPTTARGSDVLFTRMGDRFLVEAVTPRGEACLQAHAEFFKDTEESREEVARQAEARMQRTRPIRADRNAPIRPLFEDVRWAEAARRCLGCGACAFTCPTCHCFDIVDEGNLHGGVRYKNWDSCGFPTFTLHTSGHNPRGTPQARYRQRVLHKFRYAQERFGITACVGCGRCATACPVNLDIYEVALDLFGP